MKSTWVKNAFAPPRSPPPALTIGHHRAARPRVGQHNASEDEAFWDTVPKVDNKHIPQSAAFSGSGGTVAV
jgi:hypothetical protein